MLEFSFAHQFLAVLAGLAILSACCVVAVIRESRRQKQAFEDWKWNGSREEQREQPRVLDELAVAIRRTGTRAKAGRFGSSLALVDQFTQPLSPDSWKALEQHLRVTLPTLKAVAAGWQLPRNLESVGDLAAVVAQQHPEWQHAEDITLSTWREAQIFVDVRDVLVESLSVAEHEVTRTASLVADLGAE